MKKEVAIGIVVLAALLLSAAFVIEQRSGGGAGNGAAATSGTGAGAGVPTAGGSATGGAGGSAGGGIATAALGQSAYAVALARATAWESDAAPIKVASVGMSGSEWQFTFVSPAHKGMGLQVTIEGSSVADAAAIAIAGGGAPLPADIISPDDAMAKARAVPGYANAVITSLELIYNAAAKQWYWGAKTANGATITIKAT